jgi:hypothetical protein
VHWGTLTVAGLSRVPNPLRGRMRRLLVDPPREFAAAVAARGLPTSVVIVPPGRPVPLPRLDQGRIRELPDGPGAAAAGSIQGVADQLGAP